jgi:sugar phosphate isomerase/epimerase
MQLYSLRNLDLSLDEKLGQLAAMGYTGVETIGDHGLSADEMNALLRKHGLQAVSSHVGLQALESNLDGVIAFNSAIGNATLAVPVPFVQWDQRPTDAAGWRQVGRLLDKLGKRCADAGMRLLYHNHAWEMERLGGKLAIEWMLEEAKPEHLQLEPDVAWIARGGVDPVEFLKQHAGRCPCVHAKDLAPEGQSEEEKGFADVGYGTLDWKAILPAAKAAGAEWYIVEHDMPLDAMRTARRSVGFLKESLSTLG